MKYYKFVGDPDEYVFTTPVVGKVYSEDSILSEITGKTVAQLYKSWPNDWQEVEYVTTNLINPNQKPEIVNEFESKILEGYAKQVDNPNVIKVGNGDGTYSAAGQFRVGSETVTTTNPFQSKVSYVLKGIEEMLVAKNKKYGNSALEPSNVFSKLPAKEGLLLRIDDKLKRIANGSYENDDEDVINDLIGYLVLLKIVDNE